MLNKVSLIGYLGIDPDMRVTQNGTPVATFSLATNERWKDADGQAQEQTEWHRIVAWRRLAEICGQYLHKGSRVYIEGKLQTRTWQDTEGITRCVTEIIAREMKMLSTASERPSESYAEYPAGDFADAAEPPEPPPAHEEAVI